MTLDYSTLGAEVAAAREIWIENVREQFGDDEAENTRKELEADPWRCLQWYVEDYSPREPYNPMDLIALEA